MVRIMAKVLFFMPIILGFLIFNNKSLLAEEREKLNWENIKILDLRTAAHISLTANPSLAAAYERVKQAKERKKQAQSSYWPSINMSTTGSRVWLSEKTYQSRLATAQISDPNAEITDPENYYSTSLSGTWLIFDGFKREYLNASANYGFMQSEFASMDAKRLLLSGVCSTFFLAQLASVDIDIAKADENFNKRQLFEAQARRRIGTGSLSDELNFQIRVNSAKAKLINANQTLEQALYQLAELLGIADASFPHQIELAPLEPESEKEMASPEVEPLIIYALKHRSDVLLRQVALKQMEANVNIARSEFYPTLNFTASVDGDRDSDASFEGDDFGNTLGFLFTYNFFSGGSHRSKYREAKAKRSEAQKMLEGLQKEVIAQIRSSVTRVISAQKELILRRETADLVQQNRDIVEKEYSAGQNSLVRLNESQRDLVTAQSHLVLALVSLRKAWYALETDTAQILASLAD